MTRSGLVDAVAHRYEYLRREDVRVAVDSILAALSAALARGRRTEVRGFGCFEIAIYQPRLVRNPKTGASCAVGTRYQPRFKAGKQFNQRLQENAAL
jgi:integration host factor subunit beta